MCTILISSIQVSFTSVNNSAINHASCSLKRRSCSRTATLFIPSFGNLSLSEVYRERRKFLCYFKKIRPLFHAAERVFDIETKGNETRGILFRRYHRGTYVASRTRICDKARVRWNIYLAWRAIRARNLSGTNGNMRGEYRVPIIRFRVRRFEPAPVAR